MKPKYLLCILPALAGAALTLSSCVVTDPGYGYGGSAVVTDFGLTYGSGYAGSGYYYGPRNLRYYNSGPGVHYYRSRSHVPQQHWQHYHGHRNYGPQGYGHGGHGGGGHGGHNGRGHGGQIWR